MDDTNRNPVELFEEWFATATGSEDAANAAALATVGDDGRPSNRVVLVQAAGIAGFEFHTNYQSRKGVQLAANPAAALTYHWKSLGRAVRIEGDVHQLTADESDAYWYTRAPASRISARISAQSQPVESRADLEVRTHAEAERIGESEVGRPAHWGGYRLVPVRIEFWTHRDDRLHERVAFTRPTPNEEWQSTLLQP